MYSSLTLLTTSLMMATAAPGGHYNRYKTSPPSPYKDDSRAGHRHPCPLYPAGSGEGSRLGRHCLERDPSLSLLLLMMLLPRYPQKHLMASSQTRKPLLLSSSAMLFLALLSSLEMSLMAPHLSRLQEERRSR